LFFTHGGNLSKHVVKIIVIRVSIKKREAKEQELRNDVSLSRRAEGFPYNNACTEDPLSLKGVQSGDMVDRCSGTW